MNYEKTFEVSEESFLSLESVLERFFEMSRNNPAESPHPHAHPICIHLKECTLSVIDHAKDPRIPL